LAAGISRSPSPVCRSPRALLHPCPQEVPSQRAGCSWDIAAPLFASLCLRKELHDKVCFSCSCCLLWLVFWQAGAAWSRAKVYENEHGPSEKAAGVGAITPSPSPPPSCHRHLAIPLVQGVPTGTLRLLVGTGMGNTRSPC